MHNKAKCSPRKIYRFWGRSKHPFKEIEHAKKVRTGRSTCK